MSVDGIAGRFGVAGLAPSEVDMRAAARELNKPTKKYEENSATRFASTVADGKSPTGEQAFDLFKAIGELFSGPPQGNGAEAANKFDLGAILASIFDFAGKQAHKQGPLPKDEHHVGGREHVEASGQVGDAHLGAKGRASAEAHLKADSFSETFVDGSGVGVRGGAEASAGVSAEAAGTITSDVGSIDGRAKVSAEVYARLYGEARAGPDGVSAGAKAEINGGLDQDGKFKLEFSLGIAAGVGAMVKIKLEFDTKIFGKVVSNVVAAAGDLLGSIFGAVAGLFDGGSGNGAHAGKAIAAAIKQIAPMIGQAAASAAKKEFTEKSESHGTSDQGLSLASHGTLAEGKL